MLLKKENIGKLIQGVIKHGGRFVAPKMDARQVVYAPILNSEEMVFDYVIPRNSFKEFMFPQTEAIAQFTAGKDGISFNEVKVVPKETVIFGARPCDCAAAAALRSVFTWDFIDEFYTKREDKTIVITVACTKGDDSCFCRTVDVEPDGKQGSDILLKETEDDNFIVEAITDKGKNFIAKYKEVFSNGQASERKIFNPEPLKGIDLKKIKEKLKATAYYDNPGWAELLRKCIGCGACTYSCPTCHCFDIADEGAYAKGERRKNWDSCQFNGFTLHASGHNPRDTQWKRWRNRFMCKFNFYPEKFSSKGCVGCGRCVRVCPVRLDIREVMEEISR